jgi:hypothetical protein
MNAIPDYFNKYEVGAGVRQFIVPLIVFGIFAGLTLEPLWGRESWPENHEHAAFILREKIYIEHFRFHDFFPIWSSVDNDGFGSPQPLFYHKLFYLAAAWLFVAAGSLKVAIVLAVFLFLLIGAFGMQRMLQDLVVSRLASVAGGLALIAANYTVTNWLVRGALAEFSAAMLVPWALQYFARTAREGRVHPGLAISLGLIYLSHSVIFFYLILLCSAAFLVLFAVGKTRLRILPVKFLLFPFVLFAAITVPYLLPMSVFAKEYDIRRIVPSQYHPNNQMHPLMQYLWDSEWVFGRTWQSFTVQLDFPVTCLISIGLISLLHNRISSHSWKKQVSVSGQIAPIVVVGIFAAVLQTRIASSFYNHFPGAAFIQFPWRLLALITPIAIMVGLYVTERELPNRVVKVFLGIFIVSMLFNCGAFAPIRYGRLPQFDAPLVNIRFSAFSEYVPKAVSLPPYTKEQVWANAQASGCSVESDAFNREAETTDFRVTCANPVQIALPVFSSPVHWVTVSGNGKLAQQKSCIRSTRFVGLCEVDLPAGTSSVDIQFPTYLLFLKWLLTPEPSQKN